MKLNRIEKKDIQKRVVKLLRENVHNITICQPNDSIRDQGTELSQGIEIANRINTEVEFSIYSTKPMIIIIAKQVLSVGYILEVVVYKQLRENF